MLLRTPIIALFLITALAGCVSGDDPQAQSDEIPEDAGPAQVTDETGGLEGQVTDDEGVPIGGATIALVEADLETKSDTSGKYAFSEVAPGTYTVFAGRLGYEAPPLVRVEIQATEISGLDIVLSEIQIVEARHVTVIWNGHMACGITVWPGLYSEECGQGVGTPVGTFGANPNNKIDWHFDMLAPALTVLSETTWDPTTTGTTGMWVLLVENMVCDPSCGWDKLYSDTESPAPVRVIADNLPEDGQDYPRALTIRHWPANPNGGTDALNVVLEQPFEVYRTEFYGQAMEDSVGAEWSALPPS